jgi:cytochrome c oxidase subunit 2
MTTNRKPSCVRGSAGLLAILLGLLIVAGVLGTLAARSRWWLPPLASAQGRPIDRLFLTTFVIISAAFILVQGLLALFVWLYRDRGQRATYWHEHRSLELTYTIVPAIVMAGLTVTAAGLWARLHSAPPPDALVVEVRAEQFGWKARYPGPDGAFGRIDPARYNLRQNPLALDPTDPAGRDDVVVDASVREMHLVVNRPAELRVRAKDVLHSFFVPAFRIKQDAVPGMTVSIWVTPTETGTFEIACAELCGLGHYVMRGKIIVQSQPEFDAWLAQARP